LGKQPAKPAAAAKPTPYARAPKSRDEERRMLALALSMSAAEARGAMAAVESHHSNASRASRDAQHATHGDGGSHSGSRGIGGGHATGSSASSSIESGMTLAARVQRDGSHRRPMVEVAAELAQAQRQAAAHFAAASTWQSSDDDAVAEGEAARCMIWGCKRQLLRCHGVKTDSSDLHGCAEVGHVLCAPCLERWWGVQNQLRAEKQLEPLVRRSCPVCRCELRRTGGAMRADPRYFMGLLKLTWSW